jgi:mannose-6-phosphate isomerase-like protein (cupin superfamily)
MRIVEKPWGHEEIWAETDRYVGKYLHIKSGKRLSRQYHQKKEETIRVLEGELLLELGTSANIEQRMLKKGEVYHITPNTIHRFCAVKEDVILVEVSTTELDDVVRISDDYNRH